MKFEYLCSEDLKSLNRNTHRCKEDGGHSCHSPVWDQNLYFVNISNGINTWYSNYNSLSNVSSVEWICECVWNDWKVSLSQSTHSPLLMWIKSSRPLTILRYCCSKRIYTMLNIHNSSQLFEHVVKSSFTHLNFKWWEFFVVLPMN